MLYRFIFVCSSKTRSAPTSTFTPKVYGIILILILDLLILLNKPILTFILQELIKKSNTLIYFKI